MEKLHPQEHIIVKLNSNFEVNREDKTKSSGLEGGAINLIDEIIHMGAKAHQINFDNEERFAAVIFLGYFFSQPAIGVRLYDIEEDYDNPCPKYFIDNAAEISKKIDVEVNKYIAEINALNATFAVFDANTTNKPTIFVQNGCLYSAFYDLGKKTYIEPPKIEQKTFVIEGTVYSVVELYNYFIHKKS